MESWLQKGGRAILLFLTGGMGYFCMELAWRGWSHPAMVAVGGVCFWGAGEIKERLGRNLPLALQAIIAAGVITGVEFLSGCFLNLWMDLGIWDYSAMPGNVLGQICPQYAALWCGLAFPLLWLNRALRRRLDFLA